jgi:hypothetical protein
MISFVKRHLWLSALLLVGFTSAALVSWQASAGIRGQLMAHFDVSRGRYAILVWGLPPTWRSEDARLLRARYGVEERVVADCIVTGSLIAFTAGYNRVSMDAANRKFEHDIFRETESDAERLNSAPVYR